MPGEGWSAVQRAGPGADIHAPRGAWSSRIEVAGGLRFGRPKTGYGRSGVWLMSLVAFLAPLWPTVAVYCAAVLCVPAIVLTRRRPSLGLPDALAFALAAWVVATLDWTSDPVATRTSAFIYSTACLLFVAVRQVVRDRRQFQFVALAHVVGCTATSVKLIAGSETSLGSARTSVFDYSVRYGVDGLNLNYTAYTLVTGTVVAAVLLLLGIRSTALRWSLIGAVLIMLYGVLLTGTKGATIGVILGAGYLVAARIERRRLWPAVGIICLVVLVVVPVTIVQGTLGHLGWLDGLFGRASGDFSGRLEVWPYALADWGAAPLLGMGAGVFQYSNPLGIGAHNLLLTLGSDLGWVGVLLYAMVFGAALSAAARWTESTGRTLAGLFTVALTPIWISGHWENGPGPWLTLALISVAWVTSPGTPLMPTPTTRKR